MTLHVWEKLGDFEGVGRFARCKVPGGWIYVLIALGSFQRNMVFVPDTDAVNVFDIPRG